MCPELTDPMERRIQIALEASGIPYTADHGGGVPEHLDFHIPDFDLFIEVKRFHSERIGEQMSRVENVIVAQGEKAVSFLAYLIGNLPR